MTQQKELLKDFHWLMDVLQYIDVGLVIMDKNFNIQIWNSFMQNHSAMLPSEVLGKNVFTLFEELPESWFRRKVESVFILGNSAFTTWEQRPYLFKFKNYRPITGAADFMYQNSTIIPLKNANGDTGHICLIVYDVTEVAVNRIQLEHANLQLEYLSQTDGLTGLFNRKTWDAKLEYEYRRCERHQGSSCIIMFDIDHFKRVNDTYGHPAGDEVIRQTAETLKNCIREIDVAGRYGGEEFAIITVDTDAEGALLLAERLRKSIESKTIKYDEYAINFTISLGIAQIPTDIVDPIVWLERADKALYLAKRSGRNNSVIFSDSE